MSPRHLVLIGLMGAGKSTVGARCADALGRAFVDTDELVAMTAGATVPEIFARDGEAAFRELEHAAIADACAAPVPAVIAAGGGAVLDARNRELMHGHGFVVWLQAPAAELAKRVGAGADRPLLRGDPGASLARLESVRAPAYEATADAVVDTAGRSVDAVVADVLAAVADAEERVG